VPRSRVYPFQILGMQTLQTEVETARNGEANLNAYLTILRSTAKGVETFGALPALGQQARIGFLTTDEKVYIEQDAAWKALALDAEKVNITSLGIAGGVATLDGGGKVPDGQIASTISRTSHGHVVTLVGDITASANLSGNITTTLAVSGVDAGTYTKVTVNTKGLVTASGSLANTDLPVANADVGTFRSVTVNDRGIITAASNPDTLSGYGITDAMSNGAGTPSVTSGTFAGRPAAGTAGRLYVATDTYQMFRDTGAVWDLLGITSGTGLMTRTAAGTATNRSIVVTGNGIAISNGSGVSGNPSLSLSFGTSSTNVATGNHTHTIQLTTDVTSSAVALAATGTTNVAVTLATQVGLSAGTYKSVTVNTKGLVTGGTNPTTLSGYGISDAVPSSDVVTVATPNKILKLNGSSKLPASITGDANSVGGQTLVNLDSRYSLTAHNHNATYLALSGGTLVGALTLSADPVSSLQPATKQYTDNSLNLLAHKTPVRAATTVNITLSGLSALDGVAINASDRILVKNQNTATQNGIYLAAAGAWTRAADNDISAEMTPSMIVYAQEGTVNADSGWMLTTNGPITLGSSNLTFTQITGLGQVTAGTGLSKSANTISADIGTGASQVAAGNHTHTFASLTSKPSTVSGFGIGDAVTLTGAESLTNKTLASPVITGVLVADSIAAGLTIESALPVSGAEPEQVETALGPAIEFINAATKSAAFTFRWPLSTGHGLGMEIKVAADAGNEGTFLVRVAHQINGGAATNTDATVTPGNNTNLFTADLGTLRAAGTLANGDLVTVTLSRVGADGADTHTGKLRLYHSRMKWI